MKIYSHRVDDTHASGHRILESLSRNGNAADAGEEDDQTPEGESGARSKVGTKAASRRLNIAETIERNIESLNGTGADNTQTTDPMFHKMSKAFDEGGAKGMLMNNMVKHIFLALFGHCHSCVLFVFYFPLLCQRVSNNSCNLVFAADGLFDDSPVGDGEEQALGDRVDSSNVVVVKKIEEDEDDLMDISDLIYLSGIDLSELAHMSVCPSLSDYRTAMDVVDSAVGMCSSSVAVSFTKDLSRLVRAHATDRRADADDTANTQNNCDDDNSEASLIDRRETLSPLEMQATFNEADEESNHDNNAANDNFDNDYDDDVVDHAGGEDNDFYSGSTNEEVNTESGSISHSSKIQWDSVFEKDKRVSSSSSGLVGDRELHAMHDDEGKVSREAVEFVEAEDTIGGGMGWQDVVEVVGDEYSYFNIDAMTSSNAWAGARHWKFASKARITKEREKEREKSVSVVSEEVVLSGKSKAKKPAAKSKAKGAKFQIDFLGEAPSEALFAVPNVSVGKRKVADPTLLTGAAIQKAVEAASAGELCLPPDCKLLTRDLCRLMLCPSLIVPPAGMRSFLFPPAASSSSSSRGSSQGLNAGCVSGSGDRVWGEMRGSAVAKKTFSLPAREDYVDNECSGGGGGDDYDNNDYGGGFDDDDADDFSPVSSASASQGTFSEVPTSQGLAINTEGLLKAARTVEKVDVG